MPKFDYRSLMNAPKAQLSFEVPPDNSDAPFVPPYRTGIVPVGNDVPHPMENEIAEALYFEKSKAIPEPTQFTKLKDVDEEAWIDTPQALQAMVENIAGEPAIAVDLEHHDFRSFLGFTCLMQISTRQRDWVVDTIRLRSYVHDALMEIFENPNVVNVLHGGNSDVTWLERDFGIYVINMFDTCLAAKELTGNYMSLDHLQELYCGLDKAKELKQEYQCSDWRKRPLSTKQLMYARSDTHYLLYIYDRLRQLLYDANKLSDALVARADYSRLRYVKPSCDDPMFEKQGFQRGFNPRQIHLLHALVKWRVEEARKLDEGCNYIMGFRVMFQLAKHRPMSKAAVHEALQIEGNRKLSRHLRDNGNFRRMLAVICKASQEKLDEEWVKAVEERKKVFEEDEAMKAAEKEAAAAKEAAEKEKGESNETRHE